MHPALSLPEIQYAIFSHFRGVFKPRGVDLVSLASTCRLFKEPALDVLWSDLDNLSPLVRCLPGAYYMRELESGEQIYTLQRDLEPAEVDTLKSYTRRVRHMSIQSPGFPAGVDRDSLVYISQLLRTEPLFPNLRKLLCMVTDETFPLLRHIAVPNLRHLTLLISMSDPSSCEDFVHSLGSSCPAIKDIRIDFYGGPPLTGLNVMNHSIHRWTYLRSMGCSDISLDIDTFFQLSRMPHLEELSFTLEAALINQIDSSQSLFVFPALRKTHLRIRSIAVPISKFFIQVRLPAVTGITLNYIGVSPCRDTLRAATVALQVACTRKPGVNSVTLFCSDVPNPGLITQHAPLVLNDILHLALLNVVCMHINVDLIVDMKDDDLLALASNCPRIESLLINSKFGWRSSGITPAGLVQCLRRCPLLWHFCIVLDTRGYQVHPHHHQMQKTSSDSGIRTLLPSRRSWTVLLADSVIEAEAVPALATFFSNYFPLENESDFYFSSWHCDGVRSLHREWKVYQERWKEVERLAKKMILARSERNDQLQVEPLVSLEG